MTDSLKSQIKTIVKYLQRIGFISYEVSSSKLSTLLYEILSVFRNNILNTSYENDDHCYYQNKKKLEYTYKYELNNEDYRFIPYLQIYENGNVNTDKSIIISAIFSCILSIDLYDFVKDEEEIKKKYNRTYTCSEIFRNTISIFTQDIYIDEKSQGNIVELSRDCKLSK
jgi:hypothetical protein